MSGTPATTHHVWDAGHHASCLGRLPPRITIYNVHNGGENIIISLLFLSVYLLLFLSMYVCYTMSYHVLWA